MKYTQKLVYTLLIILLSAVNSNYAVGLENSNKDFTSLFDTNSQNTFYNNYQSNWNNLVNFNSNFPSAEKTVAKIKLEEKSLPSTNNTYMVEICNNGIDDDADGLIDYDDDDCQIAACGQSLLVSQDIGRATTPQDFADFESCVFDISPDGQYSAGFVDFRAAVFNTFNRTYTQIYDPLGGTGLTAISTAYGISATNEAVGYGKIGPAGANRAFYWAPGMATMVELATNDAAVTFSFANEISDNGVIVGSYRTAAGSFGIIWKTSDLANPIIVPSVKEFTTVSGTGTLIAGYDQNDKVVVYDFNAGTNSAALKITTNLVTTNGTSTAKHISTDGRYLVGLLSNKNGYRYDITNDVMKTILPLATTFATNNRGYYEHVSPDGSITGSQRFSGFSTANYYASFWDATKEQWLLLDEGSQNINSTIFNSWNLYNGGAHSDDPTMRVYSGFGNNQNGSEDSYFIMPCKVGLGNTVYNDANLNSTFDAGEGIDGVTLQLFNAGDDVTTDTPLSETITHDDGLYFFGQLAPGNYFVHIPSSFFGAGNAIDGLMSIPSVTLTNGYVYAGDDNTNSAGSENGVDKTIALLALEGISSGFTTLSPGTEPTGSSEAGNQFDYDYFGDTYVDLTLDIGFRSPVQENCTNGIDDDGDGLIDTEDPDCQLFDCGQSLVVAADIGRAVTNSDYENFESCVFDISPDGQHSAGFVDWRAAIFNTYNRTYTQIYDPLGGTGLTARSTTYGVSAAGEGVGDGKIGPAGESRAFYWAPGMATMVELATNDAGVTSSFATEISDNGVIVGSYSTAAGSYGIIWKTSDLANPIIVPAVKEFTTVSGTGTLIAGTDQSDNVVIYNFNAATSAATLRTTSNLTTTTNSSAKHISTDGRYLIGELNNGTGYRYDITNDVLKVIESAFPNYYGSSNRGYYDHVSPDGSITGTQRTGRTSNARYTTAFWDATIEQWIYFWDLAEDVNQEVWNNWNIYGGGQHSDDPTMRVYSAYGNNTAGWEDSVFILPCKVGVGNTVFADANNNGVFDSGEGIDEVTVQLFNSGDDPKTATPISETITHNDGLYFFGQLADGDYFVHIPSTQFGTGNPIGDLVSINGDSSITDDNAGEDGINGAYKSQLLVNGISSSVFNLSIGTEPVDAGTETGNVNDYDYFGDADVDLTIDFGFNTAIIGSIGDTVWYDANADGIQSGATELGLEGATVTLDPGTPLDTNDDVTDTTDANGNYLFDNLPAGDYTITVDVSTVTGGLPAGLTPANLAQTFDADGTGTANTSDYTLAAGEDNVDQDFGYQGLGSLGDRVWYDETLTGDQGLTEPGLEGATVTLDPGTPGDASDDVTTTTDANGNYLFDNLPAGDYTVTVDVSTVTGGLPAGVTPADLSPNYDYDSVVTPNTSNFTLAAGEDYLDLDFGYKAYGSIGDTVWYDANGNGTQDVGENGLPGVTVTLDPGTPGNPADDITQITAPDGTYLFDYYLSAGNYTVTVDLSTVTAGIPSGVTPADLVQTYDADGIGTSNTSNLTLSEGENNLDQDFGYRGEVLGSIGDTVWYDTDGDGIVDAGENGLEGATVTLDPGTPGNPADDIITTTDANGNYLFDNLPVGVYTITVDVSTVTGGLPVGVTIADLIAISDGDGVGTLNTSTLSLPAGANNLDQDFGYGISSGNTGTGNNGGIESESLGDALTKLYVGRKKNSVPTNFVKDASNLYDKAKMKSAQPYQGKGQTMLDMFPTELVAGNVANITSPTDILDITIADEVLSVDFSLNGQTKGVVLGIKTSDKIYNHTKASCDRLRGAEILNIQTVKLQGYNFLMQGIKQRNGIVEYAISFAVAKNNNDRKYTIQTNWYVNDYIKFNDVYNFQVWSTKPADTQKLVTDILENLQSFIPVAQPEIQKVPETYASKIYRDKSELVVMLRSTEEGNTAEVSMVELYSETANNIKFRNNTLSTEIQQSLRLDIADGYEYDGLVSVDNEVEDAFYHADGNWGLDFDKRYTEIKNYFVWNNFDREYKDDEYAINRDVEVKATSDYDYLTVYKSLLPGTISADYSEYNYVAFTAKGSGLMELGLIKSSIEDWKAQYRVMVDFSEEEQTYYVPFDVFSSSGTQEKLTAEDLTTILFTFLPVEANTKELDLFISDVKFAKTVKEGAIEVKAIENFENNFMVYPNPSKGNVNMLLFSETDTEATITLTDITGKTIYKETAKLTKGKNELEFNFRVKPGVMLLQ
ncbi:MAG: SdrD B-like domain-containing protein, partial [Polaribacter sp.]|uniref:SdrD B-like domain-containing protein n=1 Tax=Polaribacter sp. TaxID=1920175 RepID=UPI003BAFC725